jgi:hypothetical protein
MPMQQLLGFHGDMQLDMAENLVVFACEHIAHTTGCDSVDMVLDVCYSWIAAEQGILKKGNNIEVDPTSMLLPLFNVVAGLGRNTT